MVSPGQAPSHRTLYHRQYMAAHIYITDNYLIWSLSGPPWIVGTRPSPSSHFIRVCSPTPPLVFNLLGPTRPGKGCGWVNQPPNPYLVIHLPKIFKSTPPPLLVVQGVTSCTNRGTIFGATITLYGHSRNTSARARAVARSRGSFWDRSTPPHRRNIKPSSSEPAPARRRS